jgi:hypothetical protein
MHLVFLLESKKSFSPFFKNFIEAKHEFQQNSSQPIEYEDKYGFLIDTDAQVSNICQNGLSCVESTYNVLGKLKPVKVLMLHPSELTYNFKF